MPISRLRLQGFGIGIVLDLKSPIEDETASFLQEIFNQKSVSNWFAFINKNAGRVNETVVSVISKCAYRFLEEGGMLDLALPTALLALRAAEIITDDILISETISLVGFIHFRSGHFEMALACAKEARDRFRKLALSERADRMTKAIDQCKRAILERSIQTEEKCDLCGKAFPCRDVHHIVISEKPHTLNQAAHCFNCRIVVCFGCAVWRQSEEVAEEKNQISKFVRSPHCPLCGHILG